MKLFKLQFIILGLEVNNSIIIFFFDAIIFHVYNNSIHCLVFFIIAVMSGLLFTQKILHYSRLRRTLFT